MEKRRFIFDLDGTLINTDYTKEQEYFKKCLGEEQAEKFVPNIFPMLLKYESSHEKYEIRKLSEFLSKESKIEITDEIIIGWREIISKFPPNVSDGVIETLEYLKRKNKDIVVLTNWFGWEQTERLKKAQLLRYISKIYSGEEYLKPNKNSYINACGRYSINECIMIGDTLDKDVIAPNNIGLDSIYYNQNEKEIPKIKVKTINNMKQLKEMF